MNSIDLIPSAYRHERMLRQALRFAGCSLAAMLLLAALAWLLLQWRIGIEEERLSIQRSQVDHVLAMQQELNVLAENKRKSEESLAMLAALRGSAETRHLLQALDNALEPQIWLTSVQFERQMKKLEPAAALSLEKNTAPGRITMVRQSAEYWMIQRTVQIQGAASNYGAIAGFIQALGKQPGLADVRFLSSSAQTGNSAQHVSFSASASLVSTAGVQP